MSIFFLGVVSCGAAVAPWVGSCCSAVAAGAAAAVGLLMAPPAAAAAGLVTGFNFGAMINKQTLC